MTPADSPIHHRSLPLARFLPIAAFLIAATVIASGIFSSYWVDHRNDQYQLIHLGRCVYDGGAMYIDAWENKPPGIAWINALCFILSGGHPLTVWLLPGITALICITIMSWSMSELLSTFAAWCTAVLASIVVSLRLYDSPSINPDFYSAMFELAAGSVWLLALYTQRPGGQRTFAIVTGLLWAMSVNVKQTGIVGLLVVSLITVGFFLHDRDRHRDWIVTTTYVWFGFIAGMFAVGLFLLMRGSIGPAWEAVFSFNQQLLNQDHVKNSLGSWMRVREGLMPVRLVLWFGLLGIFASFYAGRAKKSSPILIYTFLIWWVMQTVCALIGPSQTMRYWQATFPPMFWLAGIGIYHLGETLRRTEKATRGAFVITLLTVVILLGMPLFEHYQHGLAAGYVSYHKKENERTRFREWGKQLRELIPEDEKIYVLAYRAGVYVHAERNAAVRFTYPRSKKQMDEIITSLEARKAFAILKPATRAPEFERFCDDSCFAQIDTIFNNYELKTTINKFEVWIRDSDKKIE